MNSETHLQDLLSAVTDALLAGDRNIDAIISRHQVSRAQVDALVAIIRRLHITLVGGQPSPQFVRRLKQDLMGEPVPNNVITRIRRLPPRVQIAAGIALLAGFMLLQRRRMQEYARQDHQVQPEPTPVP